MATLAGEPELSEGAGADATLGWEPLLYVGHEVRDVAPEILDTLKMLDPKISNNGLYDACTSTLSVLSVNMSSY